MGDFAPGDVVVCVNAGHLVETDQVAPQLVEGRHYRIVKLLLAPDGLGVEVFGVSSAAPYGFASERFRKIRPASDEFILEMRALKPIRHREVEKV